MNNETQTPLEIAKAKAEAVKNEYKAKYGNGILPLFVPVVANNDCKEFATAWLKPMTKQLLGQFMILDRTNPLAAQETVLRGLVIKEISDPRVLDDTNHLPLFMNTISTLMTSSVMASYAGTLGES